MFSSIGFIGTEHINGEVVCIVEKGVSADIDILLSGKKDQKAEKLCKAGRLQTATNVEIAKRCDLIFIEGNRQMVGDVFNDILPILSERKDRVILAFMGSGLSIDTIQDMTNSSYPVIHVLPCTLPEIGKGLILYCARGITEDEINAFHGIMEPAGLVDNITEDLINTAGIISEVIPVFCAVMIEALTDGGIVCGLSSEKVQKYTAQMVNVVSKSILEKKTHPSEIKDLVCSPSGRAIRISCELERLKFRAIAMNAITTVFEMPN